MLASTGKRSCSFRKKSSYATLASTPKTSRTLSAVRTLSPGARRVHPSVFEKYDPVAERRREVQVVHDGNGRKVPRLYPTGNQRQDFQGVLNVQVRRGFVQDQDRRVLSQRTGEDGSLLFPRRKAP